MYFRSALILGFILFLNITLHAQSRIAGKVLNDKNEPLAGVSIAVAGGGGTSTGVDGSFQLALAPGKTYTLTITAVGYAAKTINDYDPAKDPELTIALETAARSMDAVVVSGSSGRRRESVTSMIAYQKNTNTVAQVVSAEAIRRSPDKNTGEVLRRVAGTSLLEGKYLVVRGLADRYNQTMLNGVLLSSTEPDRKTFSYDIFPASMLDNMVINKAFVPELPGEWAGGLVQINTKEIPATGFLNAQLGTGFNTRTIGKPFYSYQGGSLDFLGIDDGYRAIPEGAQSKSGFSSTGPAAQAALGRQLHNQWTPDPMSLQPNQSAQINGGFNTRLFGKKLGAMLALTYNRSFRRTDYSNTFISNLQGDRDFFYTNEKYNQDVLAGGMANFTLQIDNNNKIAVRNVLNVNSTKSVIERQGQDYILGSGSGQNITATELALRQNVFFNTQIQGDHNLFGRNGLKIQWRGGFNILDQYIPDQRRLQYVEETPGNKDYVALIGSGNSQKSGSRFYSMLSDYIYNAGGDVSKSFKWLGQNQTIKAGYALQVKDRLFDSRPFFYAIAPRTQNPNALLRLPANEIFAPAHVTGAPEAFEFDELSGKQYRYLANTMLNAGYIQFDNAFSDKLRAVWGVRYENFDQLVGSVHTSDERYLHSVVGDWLPGLNLTYKLNTRTNIRLSGSQTVVRPEFRELSNFAFYDFELGATVQGDRRLVRTKVTNADLRYELYPRAGELFTVGVFYKYFEKPIELFPNQSGVGSSNTFNFLNATSAQGAGVELEVRKKLDFVPGMQNFTFSSNVSVIYNRVKFDAQVADRPMQGQSPYLLNFGLQYDLEKYGITGNLLFNRIGRRILFAGNVNQSTGVGIPEIWENPRSLLDLQLGKKVLSGKGEVRINLSDILNQPAIFYHDLDNNKKFNSNKDVQAIRRIYGTGVGVTFAYNFK
ncbi:TonB-dependent receptor [Flaviaesturariibacter flavus]|nr:TonB-dependent receptor [Flaviaesturariibacter flavus]